MKTKINCQNEELRQAYEEWIDGVYANPKGFLSARSISIFQKTVDDFARGDLDHQFESIVFDGLSEDERVELINLVEIMQQSLKDNKQH